MKMSRAHRVMLARALTVVLALLAAAGSAHAQTPTTTELLTKGVPSAHPDIAFQHTFPGLSHPQQILAGDDVPVLFTLRNEHSAAVNLTYVTGAVASPTDARFILDRFTTTAYRSGIAAGTDRSFEYRFQMNAKFPSRDFVVALVAFYSDSSGEEQYADTLFNQTISVVEMDNGLFDYEMLGTLALLALFFAAIAYAIFSVVSEQPWYKEWRRKQKQKAKAASAKAASQNVDKSGDDYGAAAATGGAVKRKRKGGQKGI